MTSQISSTGGAMTQKPAAPVMVLLTPKEVAKLLKVSLSWLAKARMRGDGPPYIQIGRVHSLQRGRGAAMDEVAAAPFHKRAVLVSQRKTERRKSSRNNSPSQYIIIHQ